VKQQTIGGKTVTRPVSDAEVQAFLKHHGLPSQTRLAITSQTSGQAQIGVPKSQMSSYPVSASHTILASMGLQVGFGFWIGYTNAYA